MLAPIVLAVGFVGTMLAWRAIAHGREVWKTLPPLLGTLGIASFLVGRTIDQPSPGGANVPGTAGQIAVGLGTGLLLFLGTRVFVVLALHVPAFARQTEAAYRHAATADRVRELVLSLLLAVPGEELLWRGLAYRWGASQASSLVAAAVVVWLAYIVANIPSRSLPIVAGAIVGGALWGWLGWWSGAVLAPLASHILWTGSMLALPPRVGRTEGDR